jgi:hypothetical protein
VQPNPTVLPGIQRVSGTKLVASDGSSCEADVIIFDTGFDAAGTPIARRIGDRCHRAACCPTNGAATRARTSAR